MSEMMVTIKKGNNEFVKTLRSNLITVEPAHDGVVFTFKEGIQLYVTDQYMPAFAKDVMQNTSNSFPVADLIFDLANYRQPVVAQAHK